MTEPGVTNVRGLPRHLLPQTARARFVAGVLLVSFALFAFAGSRIFTRGQHHAYDRGALPPPTVHLTTGVQYKLSVPGGPAALRAAGLLSDNNKPYCMRTINGSAAQQVPLEQTRDDDRTLNVFATFRSTVTGDFHITCQGITAVFVDDADNAGFDYAGLLVLVSTVLGVIGVGLTASGVLELYNERRPGTRTPGSGQASPPAAPASAADTSSN